MALIAGLVLADGTGVQSANTVGYLEVTSVAGYNWVGPALRSVGYNTIDIHEISLSGANIDPNGGDVIQFLGPSGRVLESYDWLLAADSGEKTDGWFDQGEWAKPVKSIAAGEGICVNCKQAGVTIRTVGEVSNQEVTKTSVAGFNWVGNVTPATVSIHEISLSGANIDPNGGDVIQFLGPTGRVLESYDWLLAADSGEKTDGWFDQGEWAKPERNIDGGAGICVNCKQAGVSIVMPTALSAN